MCLWVVHLIFSNTSWIITSIVFITMYIVDTLLHTFLDDCDLNMDIKGHDYIVLICVTLIVFCILAMKTDKSMKMSYVNETLLI